MCVWSKMPPPNPLPALPSQWRQLWFLQEGEHRRNSSLKRQFSPLRTFFKLKANTACFSILKIRLFKSGWGSAELKPSIITMAVSPYYKADGDVDHRPGLKKVKQHVLLPRHNCAVATAKIWIRGVIDGWSQTVDQLLGQMAQNVNTLYEENMLNTSLMWRRHDWNFLTFSKRWLQGRAALFEPR